jgi:hypothetical protein
MGRQSSLWIENTRGEGFANVSIHTRIIALSIVILRVSKSKDLVSNLLRFAGA